MSYFYRLFKLSLDPLNWIIHFGLALTWFNLKLELSKEPSWHALRSNGFIGFNNTTKKLFILLTCIIDYMEDYIFPTVHIYAPLDN